ncbi:hypothetical protein MNBD_UNCLBAC01-2020 [hydrothermal vent metagenome]|uniref:Death on curing protein, Doc toxin n=1 Tax=hydrothermal vent metagenome TaxID=652676 RepID=A0A3B1DQ30_9ZZZZ
MNIVIAKLAQQEFNDSKEFYEIEQSGLGFRFEKEIENSLLRIKQFPNTWPIELGDVRHYFVHKFPYKILYSVQDDIILILAFAHQHRKPYYWIERINQKEE